MTLISASTRLAARGLSASSWWSRATSPRVIASTFLAPKAGRT